MSNALLAVSGPAFGNMDITVYDVYTVASTTSVNSEANAITIFSGRSWEWAVFDLAVIGFTIQRPFCISNSIRMINNMMPVYNGNTALNNNTLTLIGTATSLKGGYSYASTSYAAILTAYVPAT